MGGMDEPFEEIDSFQILPARQYPSWRKQEEATAEIDNSIQLLERNVRRTENMGTICIPVTQVMFLEVRILTPIEKLNKMKEYFDQYFGCNMKCAPCDSFDLFMWRMKILELQYYRRKILEQYYSEECMPI